MNFSAEWLRCFFVKGKTRCGREEYAHLKSYRMSRFSIHLLHTHTHTQKKKKESERTSRHVTSQSDKVGQRAPTSQKNGSRQMTYKHAHMLALKTVPRKGLSISRGWWQEKKKKTRKERKQFFNTHVWASIVQGCESTAWSRYVTRFFFSSPRDIPMVNKMWRKQRLRTTTHGVNRQIFIPWKSWVIEKEGAARRYRVLLPTLCW